MQPTTAAGSSAAPSPREAILGAALELFSDRGFSATPVPRIAERAGVSVGSIYRHFPSKEALGRELYRRCGSELHEALTSDIPPGLSPREELRWLWCGLWEFALCRPLAFRFLETHHHTAYLGAEELEASRDVTGILRALIERAQAGGAVQPGPSGLQATLLHGAFVGLFRAAVRGRIRLDEESLAASEEAVWRMIAGRE